MSNFVRPTHNRQVAGVAAGIARATGIDVSLIRWGFVLGSLFSAGTAIPVLYLLGLVLMPDERTGRSLMQEWTGDRSQRVIPRPNTPQQPKQGGSVWEQPYDGDTNKNDLR